MKENKTITKSLAIDMIKSSNVISMKIPKELNSKNHPHTKISFKPDFDCLVVPKKVKEFNEFENDFIDLLRTRCLYTALYLGDKVEVRFNDELIDITNIANLAELVNPKCTPIVGKVTDKENKKYTWDIAVSVNNDLPGEKDFIGGCISTVNGLDVENVQFNILTYIEIFNDIVMNIIPQLYVH